MKSPGKAWDVVVVGGGGGGFVLALLLAKAGFRIAILEQAKQATSRPRGEIIQPNGLKILDKLGLLDRLLRSDVYRWHNVHFYKGMGEHLCAIDYQTLPPPYNYALVLLPDLLQRLYLDAVDKHPNIKIFWGEKLDSLLWEGERVVGAVTRSLQEERVFRAPVVVGGDGIFSKTREAMKVDYSLHSYRRGYLTAILNRPEGFHEEVRFYMGKEVFFAAKPVSQKCLAILYQIAETEQEKLRYQGIDFLKNKIRSLNSDVASYLEVPLLGLVSWEQVHFMSCYRVRCARWATHGAVLMGDAAHAMNPHVAQGRNAAMADAVALAPVLEDCLYRKDFSYEALSYYERYRQPEIDLLQRLSDELTFIWESRFSPVIWARERSFRVIHQNPMLHHKILSTISGMKMAPFSIFDRWRALHLWGLVSEGREAAR